MGSLAKVAEVAEDDSKSSFIAAAHESYHFIWRRVLRAPSVSRASFGNHDSARLALKAGRFQSANTVATVQLLQDGSESPRLRHESREHLKIYDLDEDARTRARQPASLGGLEIRSCVTQADVAFAVTTRKTERISGDNTHKTSVWRPKQTRTRNHRHDNDGRPHEEPRRRSEAGRPG